MRQKSLAIISKYYFVYFVTSLILMIPGILSLAVFHLRPSVDFTGGTIIEYTSASGSGTLNLPPLSEEERGRLSASLSATISGYTEKSRTLVGPTIGRELILKTMGAIALSWIVIIGYLLARFRSGKLAIAAILATIHDIVVVLGFFSILGHFFGVQVDTLFVTALLTVISFSVHDTVVVYDRLRERRKKFPGETFLDAIDQAAVQTMTRSLRNAGAAIISLTALVTLGGETLRPFAMALLIGTISGTYSSTFVALPLLVVWEKHGFRFRVQGPRKRG